MRFLLFILCLLTLMAGVTIITIGKGAVQEIFGSVFLLMASIFLVGAGIVEAVNNGFKKLLTQTNQLK